MEIGDGRAHGGGIVQSVNTHLLVRHGAHRLIKYIVQHAAALLRLHGQCEGVARQRRKAAHSGQRGTEGIHAAFHHGLRQRAARHGAAHAFFRQQIQVAIRVCRKAGRIILSTRRAGGLSLHMPGLQIIRRRAALVAVDKKRRPVAGCQASHPVGNLIQLFSGGHIVYSRCGGILRAEYAHIVPGLLRAVRIFCVVRLSGGVLRAGRCRLRACVFPCSSVLHRGKIAPKAGEQQSAARQHLCIRRHKPALRGKALRLHGNGRAVRRNACVGHRAHTVLCLLCQHYKIFSLRGNGDLFDLAFLSETLLPVHRIFRPFFAAVSRIKMGICILTGRLGRPERDVVQSAVRPCRQAHRGTARRARRGDVVFHEPTLGLHGRAVPLRT